MKIALFLGAGASVPFEKPTTKQLKEELKEKYRLGPHPKFLVPFLNDERFEDIEQVMQSIKDIKNFETSLGCDFVSRRGGLFHHWVDKHTRFDDFVKDVEDVEKALEHEVFANYAWNHKSDRDLSRVYDTIFDKLSSESDEIHVITTNYDRAIENYCELDNRFRCVDGFKLDSNRSRFLWNDGDFTYFDNDDDKENIYLYKLHGSLNWKEHSKHGLERTTEEQKPTDSNYKSNILVYPTMSPKDGHELEPYRTIRNNFIEYMDKADACVVIGFSFRDGHINEIFQEFIDQKKPLIVISPTSVEDLCDNFLHEEIPKGIDKATIKPSEKYDNIWCIRQLLLIQWTEVTIDLAFTLLKKT